MITVTLLEALISCLILLLVRTKRPGWNWEELGKGLVFKMGSEIANLINRKCVQNSVYFKQLD